MVDSKHFYIIRENTCYREFPNGRYDVGNFYVEDRHLEGFKEIAKFFSSWCSNSIDQYIFENEKEANQKALEYTIKKLNDAYDGKD